MGEITPNRGDSPCVCGAIHPCCRYLVDGGCAHKTPGDHKHAPNVIAAFLASDPALRAFDSGGPVSGQGSMPRSTMSPEVRFTDEQSAAFLSAQDGISRWAERQVSAEAAAREAMLRAHLVDRVRSELARQLDGEFLDPADDDSMHRVALVAVGVFAEVLRDPPALVTDVDGVTRVEFEPNGGA